jgi:rubrerythrin
MELTTASAIISFAVKLEDDSAKFYEIVADRYGEGRETFRSLAAENKKNRILVERAYYEVISDALEAGFSFEGLNADDYLVKAELVGDTSYSNMLLMAVEMEDIIQRFYLDAAERSQSLLADVPRAFERVAKKRNERKLKLRSLLKEE